MDHRRTPTPNPFVPPSWFLVTTIVACLGAAGWFGWLLADGGSGKDAAPTPAVTSPAVTTPTPTATTPAPTETTSTPTPTVPRDGIEVSVLNDTGTPGAASTFSAKVKEAGWTVGGVGNWRGAIPTNTVYYPTGRQPEAELLGKDVGIDRILPSVTGMRTDRLTIILAGPQ